MTVSDTHADTIRAAIKADSCRDTDDLILKGHGYNALAALVAEVERVTAKADCGGINCGKCQQCLTVQEYFLKESVTALRAEVERERARADRAEAALRELRPQLSAAAELAHSSMLAARDSERAEGFHNGRYHAFHDAILMLDGLSGETT